MKKALCVFLLAVLMVFSVSGISAFAVVNDYSADDYLEIAYDTYDDDWDDYVDTEDVNSHIAIIWFSPSMFAVSAFASGIVVLVLLLRHRTVKKAKDANNYCSTEGITVLDSNTVFIGSKTTSRKISQK